MSRAIFQHDDPDQPCPSLIDLAALAEGRLVAALGEDQAQRIEAHVAGCSACLEALEGLGTDVPTLLEESRLLMVPAHVLDAAMSLRSFPTISTHRTTAAWLVFARRGLAAAAAVGIAIAGYQIGQSFTAVAAPADASAVAISADDLAFGVLGAESADDDEQQGIFALALAGVGVASTQEAAP